MTTPPTRDAAPTMEEQARAQCKTQLDAVPGIVASARADALAEGAAERDALRAKNERLRDVLESAYVILAFAFHRIHSLPRSRDSELASDIGRVRARIEVVLNNKSRAAIAQKEG